jgi:citrate synthase
MTSDQGQRPSPGQRLRQAWAAEQWIREALACEERVMGFGHRVYKAGDVRAGILKGYARQAAERTGQSRWGETADHIERVMAEEKKLFPNLDWPAGRLHPAMGLDVPLYTPIFVMAQVAGWSGHVVEQLDHNRLIRPRPRSTGSAARSVSSLSERE